MFGSKVLVVEDNADIAAIYVLVLKQQGFQVMAAVNGEQALNLAASFMPQVILLDIMLPDVDGLTVLGKLRGDDKYAQLRPVVIMMTNLEQAETIERAKTLGADGYVVKANVKPEDVVHIVRSAVDRATRE